MKYKKTVNIDFDTRCKKLETALKRFYAKYPELEKDSREQYEYMYENGIEHEDNAPPTDRDAWTWRVWLCHDDGYFYFAWIEREPEETEPEQPETEPAEADETETETNEQEEPKMFENIIKAIAEAAQEQGAKFFAHMETCTTIGALRNDDYVKRYTTPKQCERLLAMDDSEAIPSKDYMKIMNKYTATIQKRQKAAIDKLYAAEAAEMPQNIALHITWTRNNTWGWNPHVECTVDYKSNTYGTASGCGYDKTSAAAAEALNASTAVLKALYTWVNEGGYTYGVNTPDRLHWISAPYFEGGCGMSTIRAAFEAMGYKCEDRTHYNRRGTEESRNVYFYKD